MRDVHVHFLHGNPVGYNIEFLRDLLKLLKMQGLMKYICLNIPINLLSLREYMNQ